MGITREGSTAHVGAARADASGRGMALVTWNVGHFKKIEGLRVVTPREIIE